MLIAVVAISITWYIGNENIKLEQNTIVAENNSINLDLIINFGNGTVLYFNQTSVPDGFSMYNSTQYIIGEDNIDSTYYSEFNAYFVNSIFDTANDSNHAWSAWKYEECCKWQVLDVGSNLYILKNKQTIAWYYQDVNEFGLGNPN